MSKANKLISCKTCGAEIAASAKSCPHCGAKKKKPIYNRVWFILIIVIIIAVAAVSVLKKAVDHDVTVKIDGNLYTIKASAIYEMVENDMQEYLDTFVNTDAEITFTAKVQDVSLAYDPKGTYDGMTSYGFPYFDVVSLDNCEKGDTVNVVGKFVDARKVGENIDYIRLYATSIEVIK